MTPTPTSATVPSLPGPVPPPVAGAPVGSAVSVDEADVTVVVGAGLSVDVALMFGVGTSVGVAVVLAVGVGVAVVVAVGVAVAVEVGVAVVVEVGVAVAVAVVVAAAVAAIDGVLSPAKASADRATSAPAARPKRPSP
jgi:hypothetical protein